ncbi:MAG: transaldolase [Gammaproteobacteria bacterium]|nr:transaldolase [Gammaproteobacteria bacterium]
MKRNPLTLLAAKKQSVWYDNIHRAMIHSGELVQMVQRDGLRGVTSNPTIFEKAITGSDAYDTALLELARNQPQLSSREYFFALAIEDIRNTADILRPVYEQTNGRDGMVSLEVSPDLAHNTEASIEEARSLYHELNRPNVMIKIPATLEGIPVIEQLIADGININATLLFSVSRYRDIAKAYMRGLKTRMERGERIDHIQSVASLFVSRVDALFDKKLTALANSNTTDNKVKVANSLMGKIAIANAKAAYQVYKDLFNTEGFETLEQAGAQTQRLLWASTGTKSPDYSDVLYIESLIGPETVNTIPPATYDAFRDHGKVAATLEHETMGAMTILDTVHDLGIDINASMEQLEKEGVESFAKSFDSLLSAIEGKLVQLRGAA